MQCMTETLITCPHVHLEHMPPSINLIKNLFSPAIFRIHSLTPSSSPSHSLGNTPTTDKTCHRSLPICCTSHTTRHLHLHLPHPAPTPPRLHHTPHHVPCSPPQTCHPAATTYTSLPHVNTIENDHLHSTCASIINTVSVDSNGIISTYVWPAP